MRGLLHIQHVLVDGKQNSTQNSSNMGSTQSTPPHRTVTIESDSPEAISITDDVIERLRKLHDEQQQIIDAAVPDDARKQPPPQPICDPIHSHVVPNMGTPCSCPLHATLNRPQAEPSVVEREMQQLDGKHQLQLAAWQRYTETVCRPAACDVLNTQLIKCYESSGGATLRCAELANDFNACLRKHVEHVRRLGAQKNGLP